MASKKKEPGSEPLLADVKLLSDSSGEEDGAALVRQDSTRSMMRHEMHAVEGCSSRGVTSVLLSVCLLVQSIMGGGLLAYPHAYKTGGVVNMWMLQLPLLVFVFVSLWVLAWCTERTKADTYQAMVKRSLGRRAEVLCVVVLIVLIFGASVVYLDICVDQVSNWVKTIIAECQEGGRRSQLACTAVSPHLLGNRSVLTAVIAGTLSLLCLGRSMASLALPSLFGFGALIFVCFVIIANYLVGPNDGAGVAPVAAAAAGAVQEESVVWWRTGVDTWLSMVPVILFSYQGHISAVPLYAELKGRSNLRWQQVVCLGLLSCVVLYNASGLLGYLQFKSATDSDILKSFAARPDAVNVSPNLVAAARGAIALAVSVTSAVFTFCARAAILDEVNRFLRKRAIGGARAPGNSTAMFLGVTYAWVLIVTATAIAVPSMGAVVAIVGNFSSFFMFLFPGACLLSYAREGAREDDWLSHRNQYLVGWTLVLLGSFVFVFGLANALYSL